MSLLRTLKLLPCLVLVLLAAGQARAGVLFDGQTVGYNYLFPTESSLFFNQDVTVGAGTELPTLYFGGNDIALDISDTNINIDFDSPVQWFAAAFNGIKIFDRYNVLPEFGSVTINPATNLSGFTQSNITFDGNNIFINWQGLTATSNSIVSLDVARLNPVVTDPVIAAPTALVPEPASLAVLGIGAMSLVAGGWRRRRA